MGTRELSETAYLIAWGRSQEPALSLDPYAHLWLTEKGIAFSKGFAERVTPRAAHLFSLRSRYVVERLREFERVLPGFVFVNVGSGMTSYPFLLSGAVSVINVDQPHVLGAYRERADRLMAEGLLPRREIVGAPMDLNSEGSVEAFSTLLSRQRKPAFVLFEGILSYLRKELALALIESCSRYLVPGSRVVVHVALEDFSRSPVWRRVEEYFVQELHLPIPRLTSFQEAELTSFPGLSLLEHVGYRDIQRRLGKEEILTDDELIDERFFLFEKAWLKTPSNKT